MVNAKSILMEFVLNVQKDISFIVKSASHILPGVLDIVEKIVQSVNITMNLKMENVSDGNNKEWLFLVEMITMISISILLMLDKANTTSITFLQLQKSENTSSALFSIVVIKIVHSQLLMELQEKDGDLSYQITINSLESLSVMSLLPSMQFSSKLFKASTFKNFTLNIQLMVLTSFMSKMLMKFHQIF